MNSVVHFEMPAEDKARTKKFYETVFGWEMKQLGEEMGNYLVATTAPTSPDGMNTTPGTINGGFYDKGAGGTVPHLVIAVENLGEKMEEVKKGGGEIQGETMDIPGIGMFVMFLDTEGNRVGMLQPHRK